MRLPRFTTRRRAGMTLVEVIVAFTILMLLATMAVPLARYKVRRDKERELRWALREIHTAIDKYKDDADAGKLGQIKMGTEGYPETLQSLVDGVKLPGDRAIEGVDCRRGSRQEHDPFATFSCGEPGVDRCVDHRLSVAGDLHPFVSEVGIDGGGDVAVAEVAEGVLLPLLLLSSVHAQLGDADGVIGCPGEAAAGADLGELVVVADEEDPATDRGLRGDGGFESAEVGHAGFVDHQQAASRGVFEAGAPVVEQAVQGARREPDGIEFERCSGRWCRAEDVVSAGPVGICDGSDGKGLAGTCRPDQYRDCRAGAHQGVDSFCLINAEHGVRCGLLEWGGCVVEGGDESFLDVEYLPARPGGYADRDRVR